MNKFTTDRYDGQRCQVSIVSSSRSQIQGEHNAVEVRYLDEAYLLDAVCSYIRYRYMDDDCEATQHKLLPLPFLSLASVSTAPKPQPDTEPTKQATKPG